jgi:hypothetical protein
MKGRMIGGENAAQAAHRKRQAGAAAGFYIKLLAYCY